MAFPVEKPYLTPQEYLEMEEKAITRHEYFDGEIFDMAGGTADHSTIAVNIIRELSAVLKNKSCRVFNSDMRLNVTENEFYTYPDITVVCGKTSFLVGRNDTLLNPILIVEVTSKSTKDYDRTEKFGLYRGLTSLREYVLVDSERIYVEHFQRQEDGAWLMRVFTRKEDEIPLPILDVSIPLQEMYLNVDWQETTMI